jgi:hypothetical protein
MATSLQTEEKKKKINLLKKKEKIIQIQPTCKAGALILSPLWPTQTKPMRFSLAKTIAF